MNQNYKISKAFTLKCKAKEMALNHGCLSVNMLILKLKMSHSTAVKLIDVLLCMGLIDPKEDGYGGHELIEKGSDL